MAEKVVIDATVLDAELAVLRAVREQSGDPPHCSLVSKGHTARAVSLLPEALHQWELALDQLVDTTISFLENVKDSFVDVDEEAAAAAVRLIGVLS
jgi:hypothetical protein